MGNHISPELKEKLDEAKDSRALDATFLNIEDLSDEIKKLSDLTEARLDYNRIVVIPNAICDLVDLSQISARGNRIVTLPKDMKKLENLTKLDLSFNRLGDASSNWQKAISKCISLQELDLSFNQIETLEGKTIANLTNLKKLFLQGNHLQKLPKEVQQLVKLITLNLRHNRMDVLCAEIGNLVKLTELNLSENRLMTLPHQISQLIALKRLDINDNQLKDIPHQLCSTVHLQGLLLFSNQLTKLPSNINQWNSMTRLVAANNFLTDLPPEIGDMSSLNILNGSHNKLTKLPTELAQLKYLHTLNLSHNKLAEVPKELTELDALKIIHLQQNNLVSEGISTLWTLTHLAELNLAYNSITSIPEEIAGLSRLRYLNLSNNQIASIPEGISFCFQPSALLQTKKRILFLSYNKLTEFPLQLANLKGLDELHIGGNKINHVPTQISALKELQVLSFSCNEGNLVLPKEICSLPKLKKIYLYSPWGSVTLPKEINEMPLLEVGISYFNPWPTSINELASVIKVPDRPASLSHNVTVGAATMLGVKGEDRTVIKGSLVEEADLFATFDGHGGKEVSHIAAEHFHKILTETLERNPNPEEALRSSFADMNTLVRIEVENNNIGKKAGSTAVAALLYKKKLYVANIGDSRAILRKSNGEVVRLSTDHKPSNESEMDRVLNEGGIIQEESGFDWRVSKPLETGGFGTIAITRSLGDFYMSPPLSASPEITVVTADVLAGARLIIACDGVWDVLSDEEAAEIVCSEEDSVKASIKLRDASYTLGSGDDISVIVVHFGHNI